jgi:hypothetical protein
MRFHIKTVDELVGLVEDLAQKARSEIGTTRTKLESNELKGQVYAYNEVLFYIKEYDKTQKELASGSTNTVESVDNASLTDADLAAAGSTQPLLDKIKG